MYYTGEWIYVHGWANIHIRMSEYTTRQQDVQSNILNRWVSIWRGSRMCSRSLRSGRALLIKHTIRFRLLGKHTKWFHFLNWCTIRVSEYTYTDERIYVYGWVSIRHGSRMFSRSLRSGRALSRPTTWSRCAKGVGAPTVHSWWAATPPKLSHRVYTFNGFRKSIESQLPPKTVSLLFTTTDWNNKVTILWMIWPSKTIWLIHCVTNSTPPQLWNLIPKSWTLNPKPRPLDLKAKILNPQPCTPFATQCGREKAELLRRCRSNFVFLCYSRAYSWVI